MEDSGDEEAAAELDWLVPEHSNCGPRPGRGSPAAAACRDSMVSSGSVQHRIIMHLDLDCFYAQVEMICNPDLRNKPLGVYQKSLLVTCNYKARDLGVKKCMFVKEAKENCPGLVLVNGEDLTKYREISYKVTGLLFLLHRWLHRWCKLDRIALLDSLIFLACLHDELRNILLRKKEVCFFNLLQTPIS